MAAEPVIRKSGSRAWRLVPFQAQWAPRVAAWVKSPTEGYWLAPKSTPPLDAATVLQWRQPGHEAYQLVPEAQAPPVAYGELNSMIARSREYWLGHLIVDPQWRGRGVGLELTRRLLREAFDERGATRVTLVVFPENQVAVRCYKAAGMADDGYEWHTFAAAGRRECLLRLAISRPMWGTGR